MSCHRCVFAAVGSSLRVGEMRLHYPTWKRRCKQAATGLLTALSLVVVGFTMFFFLWLYDEWANSGFLQSQIPTIGWAVQRSR